MKKAPAILTALALGSIGTPLMAGVVMTQEIIVRAGSSKSTIDRTVMTERNKQKTFSRDQAVVLDLDAGKIIQLNPAAKTYTQSPFSPQTPIPYLPTIGSANIALKKTGKVRTIAGYKCAEYAGTQKSRNGWVNVTGCFSSRARGAAEYTAFTEHLAKKYVQAGMSKPTGSQLPGIPIDMTMGAGAMTPLGRLSISYETTTTRIKIAKLPADTFGIPTGYTERATEPAGAGAPAPPAKPN